MKGNLFTLVTDKEKLPLAGKGEDNGYVGNIWEAGRIIEMD